jgi:EAL domain-containing protein (putative c-di-GMP-specific phosphodiesterase class I)
MLDEKGEIVAPNEFITAERYGLITKIDCGLIETFFSIYHKLSGQQFISKGLYTLNISGDSIGNNGFMRFLINNFIATKSPHKPFVLKSRKLQRSRTLIEPDIS